MNILIVYSHPSKKSYTFQILKQLEEIAINKNWHIEVSDLYANNFQSNMTAEEYEREGFADTALPIPQDVAEEHKKIENTDCIIFLYPVWWSDCPAIMKGWFDRVYAVGYAYGQKPGLPKMKMVKYGITICTAGHPNDFLNETGIAQSMQTVMLDDRLGKRFERKEMLILGGTLEIETVRQKHREQINELFIKIADYCS
ncbi:NAD(P)H-dependent oxidoreductase [Sphingobacterium sp. N143]|uniref:NAD(P)H-dependent oxidoreductase n=1 Tax=Sphingobacterium sp. N143 TaxID=2746727 RepID=UPI0025779FA9|nr:NAD(P)H-dependent oxidoreductase [Sphingobacterium sp. N143]MDM1294446.1 NAD(P)H-dependent oxidoreductase [Sphingobacterium sp. N143]